MKSIFLFCILFSAFAATKVAHACSPLAKRQGSKSGCYSFSFQSPSLNRPIDGNVWLPLGYGASTVRFPYAIFLHGRNADREMFTKIAGGPAAEACLDQLWQSVPQPFLVFTVSGGNHYWMNAARSKERWGDLITEDLVQYIEQNFDVIRGSGDARALMGVSMGAAGVLQLGFHSRGTFATAVAMSPVIRRETEIWKPGTPSQEPREDYDSFGEGASYHERNPRDLCEKNRRSNGSCLPFDSFRLDAGEADEYLVKYTDSRVFTEDLKRTHPGFPIAIGRCEGRQASCSSPAECYGHTYEYWSCQLPAELRWMSARFAEKLKAKMAHRQSPD